MSDGNGWESGDAITRRQWLLRLGEMVVLTGVSGLVPKFAPAQLSDEQEPLGALPPGLYAPSADHLIHALRSSGNLYTAPPGSETEYAQPFFGPFRPQFFSQDEFRVITRFVEIVLGRVNPEALSQTTQWLDLWLHSAASVQNAAQHLDPLHRALAVAYYGEQPVRELETSNPQTVAHEGLSALHALSAENHNLGFLELTEAQQVDLVKAAGAASQNGALRKFFDVMRSQAIRGYYTSAEGLKEPETKTVRSNARPPRAVLPDFARAQEYLSESIQAVPGLHSERADRGNKPENRNGERPIFAETARSLFESTRRENSKISDSP